MAGPHRRRRGQEPARRRVEIRVTEAEYHLLRAAAAGRAGRGVSLARFVIEAGLAAAGSPSTSAQGLTSGQGSTSGQGMVCGRCAVPGRSSAVGRSAASRGVLAAEITEAVAAVNRVGNNLNQLAREKNATGRRPAGTAAEVERARVALERLARVAQRGGAS